MSEKPERNPSRLRRFVPVLLAVPLLILLLVILTLLVKPTVPAGFLVRYADSMIRKSTGLSLDADDARLTLSLCPRLSLDDARLSSADGVERARAHDVRMALELPRLYHRVLRVSEAHAGELWIDAATLGSLDRIREEDLPPSSAETESDDSVRTTTTGKGESTPVPLLIDIPLITVGRLLLALPAGEDVVFSAVECRAPSGANLELETSGAWRDQVAEISMEAASLPDLLGRVNPWPVELSATNTLGRVRFATEVPVSGSNPLPLSRLSVELHALDLAGLGMNPIPHVNSVEGIQGQATWQGWAMDEIVSSLALDCRLDGVLLESGRVKLNVHQAQVSNLADEGIRLHARADMLGLPLTIDVQSGPITSWPLVGPVHAQGQVNGPMAELVWETSWWPAAEPGGSHTHLTLTGDRLGEITALTGAGRDTELPYRMVGHLRSLTNGWNLAIPEFSVGQTAGQAELTATGTETNRTVAIVATLDRLALEEWAPEPSAPLAVPQVPAKSASPRIFLDMPILPQRVLLPNLNASVRIRRLTGLPEEIRDAGIKIDISDGWLHQAPFSLKVGEMAWTGSVELDMRGNEPRIALDAESRPIHLGSLMRLGGLDIGADIQGARGQVGLEAAGAHLRELLETAALHVSAEEIWLNSMAGQTAEEGRNALLLRKLDMQQTPDRLTAQAEFEVAGLDSRVELVTELPLKISSGGADYPTRAAWTLGGAHADLNGVVARTDSGYSLDADLELTSREETPLLESLGIKQGMSADFHVHARDRQFDVSDLNVTFGESSVHGNVQVDLPTAASPIITADLRMPRLNLDELELPASDGNSSLQVKLDAVIDEVMVASQRLGRVELAVDLGPGYLNLKRLSVHTDEGLMGATYSHVDGPDGSQLAATASVSNVPTAVFGALLQGRQGINGHLYAQLDLRNEQSPQLGSFDRLNGELGFALLTGDLRSRLFDLWGGSAIRSVTGLLTGQEGSRLQCIAGNLTIENGHAQVRQFCIDTSAVRARGRGSIDLVDKTIRMDIKPRPKKSTMISLSTPIEVRGSLGDPKIGVEPGGLIKTTLRLYFWFVTALESLFRQQIPEHDFEGYMRVMRGEDP